MKYLECEDFEVNDRVRLTEEVETRDGYVIPAGMLGTVRRVSQREVSIEWDIYVNGHALGGLCEYGYGWNFFERGWDDPSVVLLDLLREDKTFFEESDEMTDFFNDFK